MGLWRLSALTGCALSSLLALAALPQAAGAQTFPSKPIRLVIPWPPGTPADVAGRVVAEAMTRHVGQPIVVDNRPGATGTIGLNDVLQQPADGHTVYMLSSATLVTPLLFPKQSLEFLKSLDTVGHVAWSVNVLVTPTTSALRNPADLLTTLRAKPGSLSFASGGNGTPAHLAGEKFKQDTGTQMVHVPYNQFQMAIGDLLAGRVDLMFLTASAAIPNIQAKRLNALAVTAAQRLPVLPDIPTMTESGYKDFVLRSFDGMTVRAGTPPAVIQRLNADLVKAIAEPAVRERLGALALEPEPMSPEQFRTVVMNGSEYWLRIGRAAGIKAD